MTIHYANGCNLGQHHFHLFDATRVTKTIAAVTCKNCRRIIIKKNLKDATLYPSCPTFDFVRSNGGRSLVSWCPVCGRNLLHGGCGECFGDGDGHRVAHCGCWDKGYYVQEIQNAKRETPLSLAAKLNRGTENTMHITIKSDDDLLSATVAAAARVMLESAGCTVEVSAESEAMLSATRVLNPDLSAISSGTDMVTKEAYTIEIL